MTLDDIKRAMKPQFVWSSDIKKIMQLDESVEINKEMARTIFVGIAEMFGFDQSDVMDYLDCGYDSYRHKLMSFREHYKEGLRREQKCILYSQNDAVTRFYIKTGLCLNAIRYNTKQDPYLKMAQYIGV